MNESHDKILGIYHKIYQSWGWVGGHADGNADLLAVAVKEVQEETGLRSFKKLSEMPISIEALPVFGHHHRKYGYVSAHIHLNVTFLFEAKESDSLQKNTDETGGLAWIPLEKFSEKSSEKEMRVIYDKIITRIRVEFYSLSANALGAAIGAIIGGFLADKFGRKFIFTYNLLVYMTGVLIIMLSMNFPMLLAGFLVTGISVGIGVPASWTYISESSEVNNRGRNICISQMSWGVGPMCILLFGMLFAPGGYLYGPVEAIAHDIIGADAAQAAVEVFSSRVVFATLFVVAFIAWNLQRQLEESAEFTANKEKDQSSIVDNIKLLFTNKIAVKTVAFLAAIYLTWNLVASVMGFFMPHIYETAGGLSNEAANMLSCISWVFVE